MTFCKEKNIIICNDNKSFWSRCAPFNLPKLWSHLCHVQGVATSVNRERTRWLFGKIKLFVRHGINSSDHSMSCCVLCSSAQLSLWRVSRAKQKFLIHHWYRLWDWMTVTKPHWWIIDFRDLRKYRIPLHKSRQKSCGYLYNNVE